MAERQPNQEQCYDLKEHIIYDIVIILLAIYDSSFLSIFTFPKQLRL